MSALRGPSKRRIDVGGVAIYAAFAAAVVLATKPVWAPFLFGFRPTFEDLLLIRCLALF